MHYIMLPVYQEYQLWWRQELTEVDGGRKSPPPLWSENTRTQWYTLSSNFLEWKTGSACHILS